RWSQIQSRCYEVASEDASQEDIGKVLSNLTGSRLRWGISAAGYLDPKVFRFFQRMNVDLCSGFGMTEATGGITMTPPGEYIDNSVGIPLPGIKLQFSELGELKIAGPYISRYLPEKAEDDHKVQPGDPDEEYWLETGDLFRELDEGHLEIVDRIKDIYKNNKGQTVAPLRVEKKFTGVPGIQRTFLVGDGKAYNVLLIVPDKSDPVFQTLHEKSEQNDGINEYFRQIITAANRDLAPFERVINFALVDRDFDIEKDELTPKGSYKRKVIANNFSEVIKGLYKRRFTDIELIGYRVRIPQWFYRDLGILETDIFISEGKLTNRSDNCMLRIVPTDLKDHVQIGDLIYQLESEVIDLGLFARHPRLWIGNPQLIAFSPCKEGWDLPLKSINEQVILPDRDTEAVKVCKFQLRGIRDPRIISVNRLVVNALYSKSEDALAATEALSRLLESSDDQISRVIRRRIEALAMHPVENVRCLAYMSLLLDEPTPDYGKFLPAFLLSGKTFINEESVHAIAHKNLKQSRLEALRQRLQHYRTNLEWPQSEEIRKQIIEILHLLENFVKYHPEYYSTVRAELTAWILLDGDPVLSREADATFKMLADNFENRLIAEDKDVPLSSWYSKIVFEETIKDIEIERLKHAIVGTSFLKESIMLIADEVHFSIEDVETNGIWISQISHGRDYNSYRAAINTKDGKHFDIKIIIRPDLHRPKVRENNLWLMYIAGYPFGTPVLPRFGCCRADLGALSLAFLNDLTVWGKIRE
ncbi:AMP-binding protein, partial [bacterium]|nr:AMP-binding protein [bacterium]